MAHRNPDPRAHPQLVEGDYAEWFGEQGLPPLELETHPLPAGAQGEPVAVEDEADLTPIRPR